MNLGIPFSRWAETQIQINNTLTSSRYQIRKGRLPNFVFPICEANINTRLKLLLWDHKSYDEKLLIQETISYEFGSSKSLCEYAVSYIC